MIKKIICLIVLMIFIIDIFGCAGIHREFLLKREWKSDELPKDKIVSITLKDGTTYKLSIISLEGTKIIGTTEEKRSGGDLVTRTKEIDIQDIQYMLVEKSYANPSASVFAFIVGIGSPILIIGVIGFFIWGF